MPKSNQVTTLSAVEARWAAINAQGLGAERPAPTSRPPGAAQLRKVMANVGTIQLDAVNVLERTQYLVPFSRLGSYDRGVFNKMSGPGAAWFEYWGHAASLLPMEYQPLFRWRMDHWRRDMAHSGTWAARRKAYRAAHAEYIAAVLAEVTERGPLAASQLADPRRRLGEWWDRRSDGRRALEMLFADGVLSAWRRANFERVYDLTERVVAPDVQARPTPEPEEAQRQLLAISAACMGVATKADLADYLWLRPQVAALRLSELVEQGRLVPVSVEGWKGPAYMAADARLRPPVRASATLLSPFDSLIWSRPRTERLFGMRFRIEIYVPAPQRTYGYYVLPMLLGHELVGRFDLKSDRAGSALKVMAAHVEPGLSPSKLAAPALAELHGLRSWLGLADLTIVGAGDFASALAKAAGRAAGGRG